VTDTRIPVRWTPRATPLLARAVVATGAAAKVLGRRLSDVDDDALRMLTAVAGEQLLVVLGETSALPWVDGVTYLGRDEEAPELLVPTALEPTVPAAVLEAAIRKRMARPAPIAVLPSPARLIACGAARAIDRERLKSWLKAP
jgi:hypothetical protein